MFNYVTTDGNETTAKQSRVYSRCYDSLTSSGTGLLYDNANVFLGGFDDEKQEKKHKNKYLVLLANMTLQNATMFYTLVFTLPVNNNFLRYST
jgi:hypothetical protein